MATSPLVLTSLALEGVDLPSALLRTVTDVQVVRTVDGASTVTVQCDDPTRLVLNLPLLAAPGSVAAKKAKAGARRRQTTSARVRQSRTLGTGVLDDDVWLTFAGLTYALVQVRTGQASSTLVFEDQVVATLRGYAGPKAASRSTVTRSEFMISLAAEAHVPCSVQTDERIPTLSANAAITSLVQTNTDTNPASTPADVVPAAGTLSAAQIAQTATDAGCPAGQVPLFTALALAESGGNPNATNHNTNGSTDYGLWQINSVHSTVLAGGSWMDPHANALMASQVSAQWTDPTPWSTYNSGAYKAYLGLAQAAAPSASGAATGLPASTASSYVDSGTRGRVLSQGQWERGTTDSPEETSWECITRLAQELAWRAFSDGSRLWVGSDAWLGQRLGQPVQVVERTAGVEWVEGEWDPGKTDGNDLSFTTRGGWLGTLGQHATVSKLGRLSGQWLCHSWSQGSADASAVLVTLARERPDVLATVPSSSGALQIGGVTAGGETATDVQTTVLTAAISKIGAPYVWGAAGPDSFDCSGLAQWAWKQAGINIPRSSQEQLAGLPSVADSDIQPADLVMWTTPEGPASHMGIYDGGGSVIHAPHTGDVVSYTDMSIYPITGIRRPAS